MTATYAPFDISNYLDSDEAIAEYLTAASQDANPDVLLAALSHVAKAKGKGEEAIEVSMNNSDPRPRHYPMQDDQWDKALAAAKNAGAVNIEKENIRRTLDAVAFCSGYFRGYLVYERPDKRDWNQRISEGRELENAIAVLVPALRNFLGHEGDWDDDDPFREERKIEPMLKALWERVEDKIQHFTFESERASPPDHNAKADKSIDRWAAGVMRVWCEFLNLPRKDSAHLRRFMIACLPTFKVEHPERKASYLIVKVLKGEVEWAQPTLMEVLQNRPQLGKSSAERVKDNLAKI